MPQLGATIDRDSRYQTTLPASRRRLARTSASVLTPRRTLEVLALAGSSASHLLFGGTDFRTGELDRATTEIDMES